MRYRDFYEVAPADEDLLIMSRAHHDPVREGVADRPRRERAGDRLRHDLLTWSTSAPLAPMMIPLGRPGTPAEAAGGVFFLCSPWSNFVHGQVLNITGGQFTGMTT